MVLPTQCRVLRVHKKPLSSWKAWYEVYDSKNHVVYLSWGWPGNIVESIRLTRTESLKDYLQATEGAWFYEEPSEEQVERFVERFMIPVRHVCDPEFECTDPECVLCHGDTARFLVNQDE